MAETMLGMATTMVGSALGVASSAAREEIGLLLGVQDDIWFINVELKMMSAFLRTTSVTEGNTEVLKAYLELIRDLAYDTEDCLEEFIVLIKYQNFLQQCLTLGKRHRIAFQIRAIKQRIQELNQTRKRYNLTQLTHTISNDMTRDFQMTRNFAALYTEEAQLVGFEKPKAELLKLVSSETDGRKAVSIVGMGGLGKTTLARKLYDSNEVCERFVNCAWVTVSQSFSIMELLKDLIKQLLGEKSFKDLLEKHPGMTLQVQDFISHLKDELHGRRYFVVLDDLWTTEAWNSIQFALLDPSNKDNCVVVTTRNREVAEVCSSPDPTLIHYLKALEKEDAKELLLKKIHKPKDPEEDKLLDEILKKCGGLPLAIVTIGGLLANKGISEWRSLRDQLPSELASSNPSLEALRQVVTLSYRHLPSHLKPCFLYLSLFPEDFEINRKHLVNRWIAEGYIASGTTRRTLEEFAESYFYELISRSMIQPSKLGILGNVKTCRVHDIVHDIAVSISRQENHVFLVEEQTSTTMATKESIRHISCFARTKLNLGMDLSCVRSFTVFNETEVPLTSFRVSTLKMLRVLDLGYAERIEGKREIKQAIGLIGSLIHLKYLHFPPHSRAIYRLPSSIGNLRGLQTLHMGSSFGVGVPKGIGRLQDLQVLECVSIERSSGKALKELGELTQLRKLVVRGHGVVKKKCQIFSVALEKLSSLHSLFLRVDVDSDVMLNELISISSPLPFLESLTLSGRMGKIPEWVGQSMNLVKIKLTLCQIEGVETLAKLTNLMLLGLYAGAYKAEKLVFRMHTFPKLKSLHLELLFKLKELTFEESASPRMESIIIRNCNLISGINGIKHLDNLKEISIGDVVLAKQDMLRQEVDTHPNHPVLRMVEVREEE